ncbi:hypothetical protein H4219_006264, partial [Mycoemilia scoparia]
MTFNQRRTLEELVESVGSIFSILQELQHAQMPIPDSTELSFICEELVQIRYMLGHIEGGLTESSTSNTNISTSSIDNSSRDIEKPIKEGSLKSRYKDFNWAAIIAFLTANHL